MDVTWFRVTKTSGVLYEISELIPLILVLVAGVFVLLSGNGEEPVKLRPVHE